MKVRSRRRVTLLALHVYALACCFSDLWHTHHESLAEQTHRPSLVERIIVERVKRGEQHHYHAPKPHVGDTNDGCGHPSDHHDSCAVCRFVAQSSLPSLPVAEPPLGGLTDSLRIAPLSVFISSVPSDCLARAPPAAG